MQAHHEFVSHPDMFNTLRFPLVLLHLSRLRSSVCRCRVHSDRLSARRAVLAPALAGTEPRAAFPAEGAVLRVVHRWDRVAAELRAVTG